MGAQVQFSRGCVDFKRMMDEVIAQHTSRSGSAALRPSKSSWCSATSSASPPGAPFPGEA